MKKIIVIGSFNLDYVFNVNRFVLPKETYHSNDMEIHYGGKGFNQAVALGRSYPEVYFAANINEKESYIKNVLKDNHVNSQFVRPVSSPTGMAFIQVNQEGENCILLNKGANFRFDFEQFVEILSKFNEGDTLVLQNEINKLDKLIELAHKRNLKIALNPSPFNDSILNLPLNKLDYLFINEVEGTALTKENEIDRILNKCSELMPKCEVILTLGTVGACVIKKGLVVKQEAYKVETIDTTGAGDTFTGFYLASRVQDKSINDSLKIATVASALSVTKKGAMDSIPQMDEVLKILNQYKKEEK